MTRYLLRHHHLKAAIHLLIHRHWSWRWTYMANCCRLGRAVWGAMPEATLEAIARGQEDIAAGRWYHFNTETGKPQKCSGGRSEGNCSGHSMYDSMYGMAERLRFELRDARASTVFKFGNFPQSLSPALYGASVESPRLPPDSMYESMYV